MRDPSDPASWSRDGRDQVVAVLRRVLGIKLTRPCPACGRHTLIQKPHGTVFCTAERCRHNHEPVK